MEVTFLRIDLSVVLLVHGYLLVHDCHVVHGHVTYGTVIGILRGVILEKTFFGCYQPTKVCSWAKKERGATSTEGWFLSCPVQCPASVLWGNHF